MKNKYCPQLDSIIESATRKIYGYGVKSVKRGSTSQTDSKLRLEQKQVIVDAVSAALNRQREDMEKEFKEEIVSKYGDFRPIVKWGLGLVKYGRTLRFYLLPHTKHTEEDIESTI